MTKITALPADNTPSSDDYTVTVDTTSGQTKKVLLSDLFSQGLIGASGLADSAITGRKISSGVIVGASEASLNPIPTSWADVSGSSATFSLDVASTLLITFGGNIQNNTASLSEIQLNIDGTRATTESCRFQPATAAASSVSISKTVKKTLASGSHTIKLQAQTVSGSNSVAYNTYWFAVVTAT